MKRDDINLADPTAELINSYKFEPRGILHDNNKMKSAAWAKACATSGGYNPFSQQFTPLRYGSGDVSMHEALDHITAAAEAGIVDQNVWAGQLFASAGDLDSFFQELEDYDEEFRITDRWWTAIAKLVNTHDEEGLITCADMVVALRQSIQDGAQRREVRAHEASYFAAYPLKKPRLNALQLDALAEHNIRTKKLAHKKRAEADVSTHFEFTHPLYELSKNLLTARQATKADVEALMERASTTNSVAKKAKPGTAGG